MSPHSSNYACVLVQLLYNMAAVRRCTCEYQVFVLYYYCADDEIRECVFLSLDERFDPHLAQAESLTTLFVAMHDGVS